MELSTLSGRIQVGVLVLYPSLFFLLVYRKELKYGTTSSLYIFCYATVQLLNYCYIQMRMNLFCLVLFLSLDQIIQSYPLENTPGLCCHYWSNSKHGFWCVIMLFVMSGWAFYEDIVFVSRLCCFYSLLWKQVECQVGSKIDTLETLIISILLMALAVWSTIMCSYWQSMPLVCNNNWH